GHDPSQPRRPDRRRHIGRERRADVSRERRPVVRAQGGRGGDAGGIFGEPRPGAGLLQSATAAAGGGPAQCGACRASGAGRAVGRRLPAGDAERRRSARPGPCRDVARRRVRADPYARRTAEGALHPFGRGDGLGRGHGGGRAFPAPSARADAAAHRLVRGDAAADGADRGGAGGLRPVRLHRHLGGGLSGGGVRAVGALRRRTDGRDQSGADARGAPVRRGGLWSCDRGRAGLLPRPI
ncbi:hypothetical protein LTR94_012066, partial [Friedmanniomyces endolithicus]